MFADADGRTVFIPGLHTLADGNVPATCFWLPQLDACNLEHPSMKTACLKIVMKCAMVLAVAVAGIAASPANAQQIVPIPDNDPFYLPPAGYQQLPNGSVLRDRKIDAEFLLPFLSTDVLSALGDKAQALLPTVAALRNLKINAYQVLYKSLDGHNQPVTEVATILVPRGPWKGAGPRPLVSYQLAEDSLDTRCAPSYTLRSGLLGSVSQGSVPIFSFLELVLSLPALAEGYAIVYTDYEGPQSQFQAGTQTGHAVLDGIRAALRYAPAGFSSHTPIGLWGYSGGGGATDWASLLKPGYAPELNIVGIAIGSSAAADLTQVHATVNNTIFNGVLVMGLVGINRAYPEAHLTDYMTASGQQLLASADHACTLNAVLQFAFNGPIENYTIAPNIPFPASAPGAFLYQTNSAVDQSAVPDPSIPVLRYHDEFDEVISVKSDNDMALKWCKAGVPVEVMRTFTPVPFNGLVHATGEIIGALPALNFLKNRFQGRPSRNDCAAAAVWASPLPIPYYPLLTQ